MQNVSDAQWVQPPKGFSIQEGYFICQVVGESMNKKIPNGSWCLFRKDTGGSREGRVVLAQHIDIQDPDIGGQYTVKTYHSAKQESEDGWRHSKIILRPNSFLLNYYDIVLHSNDEQELSIVGIFVGIVG